MDVQVMTNPCECEHADHFDDCPSHPYGKECDLERMTFVRTPFGTFTVCVDCARTHLKQFEGCL